MSDTSMTIGGRFYVFYDSYKTRKKAQKDANVLNTGGQRTSIRKGTGDHKGQFVLYTER